MKSCLISAMLASLAVAGAQDVLPSWRCALPDTGLLPSAFSYEFASSMRERHGGRSHFGMQNVSFTIPLSDPYKSFVGGWAFNAEFDSTISFVDAEGTLNLASDTLYRFTLPLSLIRSTAGGNRLVLALTPSISSDLERAPRCFDFGFVVAYNRKVSEDFRYMLGVAASPRFARYWAFPFIGFEWKPADDWTIALNGYRLSAMHAVTGRFSAGVFASAEGGVWTVETDRGARLFNVQALVVGLAGEYDFAAAGQRKRIITAALGSTLASSVRFHECSGDREADETHHYRPGFYASFGVDFRF